MAEEDQAMRFATMEDPQKWDPGIDVKNTAHLKAIIAEIGWPSIPKVGADAADKAWLLVQHADKDKAFQASCLELMRACTDGEVTKKNVAYLEDRVRVGRGEPQLYGTQFRPGPGDAFDSAPIEDPEGIDERRASVGLDSYADYRDRMLKHHREAEAKRKKSP